MKDLTVGMRLDELPSDQIEGSWRFARNVVTQLNGKAITNENGADDITPIVGGVGSTIYPNNKKLIGEITLPNERIQFFGTTSAADSEIGRLKADGLYYPILKDAILNFNENYPIEGTFEQKFNGNIIISWVRGNDSPQILNIDCFPFNIDGLFAVIPADVEKAKSFLKTFPNYKTPYVDFANLEVVEGLGALTSGAYYPILGYELLDGTITSWINTYNGIPIYTTNLNKTHKDVNGGLGGELTGKGIKITFTNIDTNYKKLRLGYIYVSNGITTAYYEKSIIITNSTMTLSLTGLSTRTQITLNEVLVQNAVIDSAESVTSVKGALIYANVKEPEEYNFQTYANQIEVQWVREREISINGSIKNANAGTYQDPKMVFFNKTFKSGEAYAFYIRLLYKNGKRSKAFHIPGRASLAGDRDQLNNGSPLDAYYNLLNNSNPVYKFQVFNTNTNITATSGKMGYWENSDEEYPLDPNNVLNIHPDFSNISGISVADRKVRHHVFPDLSNLNNGVTAAEKFVYGSLIGSGGSYPVQDLKSKAFGIKIINVNIPVDLLPLIDGWEICYGERSNDSIRILGNDCASTTSAGGAGQINKYQQFDLMVSKSGLIPTYLKSLWNYGNNGAIIGEEANFVEDLNTSIRYVNAPFQIINIIDFFYLGENVTAPHNNSGKAEDISMNINNAFLQTFDIATAATPQNVTLVDFCIFRSNTYLGFNTRNLISTGVIIKVNVSGIQATKDIYGGDCYINRHSFNPLNGGTKAASWVVESAYNIGLRREDLTQNKFFAPKSSTPTPSWYGYNFDYNCVNNFNQTGIYYPAENCTDADVTNFPNRIIRSIPESTENSSINWRTFKISSYYETIKTKGKIIKVTGVNKTLYIHTEYSLFVARIKDKLEINNQSIASLGSSDLFETEPDEILPVNEGISGTQSKYACIVCRLGYCFIERSEGKIYVLPFDSLTPKEISSQGMYNFFRKYAQTSNKNIDNPFIGMGYTMSYNNDNNTLIVVKNDSNGYQFTISYNIKLNQGNGGWVSFHDYSPNYISYNRNGLFAVQNIQHKVYKHNSNVLKASYYLGPLIKESYIEVVFNDSLETSKIFNNFNWITTAEKNGVSYKQETITHILIYNNTQCSGKILLNKGTNLWYSSDVRNVEDTWNFSDFTDMTKDTTLSFMDDKGTLITSNISTTKNWFDMSKIISKFAICRLYIDNNSQHNVHIHLVGSNIEKSDR